MDSIDAMCRAVAADPWCDTTRLVLADAYAERDDGIHEAQCRQGPPPIGLVFFNDGDGNGDGNGYYGDGNGYYSDGYGDGNGYYGNGYYGNGDGNGYYGYGNGYGDGNGYGNGYGDGKLPLERKVMPEADGQNWLIVLPHGWVICGKVVAQSGPYSFKVEDSQVICRTGGVPWDELADGKRRGEATYRKWGTVNIGPQFVFSRHWAGELP